MNGIGITLSELLKADKFRKTSKFSLPGKDQLLDAKVLKFISPSKTELLIQGHKVLAEMESEVPLKQGDLIQLKVNSQGKLSIVKSVPLRTPESSGTLLSNIEKNPMG